LKVLAEVVTSSTNFTVTYQAHLTDLVESSTNTSTTTTLTYQSSPSNARIATYDTTSSTSIDPAAITITVNSTSIASTLNSNVAIGETVTFVSAIVLAKGITTNPVLTVTTGDALAIIKAQVNLLSSPNHNITNTSRTGNQPWQQ
jgi:hypothetical protein